MTSLPTILAISGSTRAHSSNGELLKLIADRFSDRAEIQIYNGIAGLPHFNPDLDNEQVPQEVIDFRDKLERADGILICTPEYVFSLPGTLKNALEWTVSTTILSHKPMGFIVASGSGEKAFESLDLILSTLAQAAIPEDSTLLIQGARSKIIANIQPEDELLNQIDGIILSLLKQLASGN